MEKIIIELSEGQDLLLVKESLYNMGLKFHVEEGVEDDEDWGDLPEAAIEGIKAGLADIEAGRVHSHEYVMAEMKKTMDALRKKNA